MSAYDTLDPKVAELGKQIKAAFAGEPAGKIISPLQASFLADEAPVRDASVMAGAMLSAYHAAAAINPAKAFQPKTYRPVTPTGDPADVLEKGWGDLWTIVQTVAPVLINAVGSAVGKDYDPRPAGSLAEVIHRLPPERRNDPMFVEYATNLLITLAQGTVEAMSGKKDFRDPANRPPVPPLPAGATKSWLSDAWDDVTDFVVDAAPVALPILMALI